MSIALDLFCFVIPYRTIFAIVLYVATGASGCQWPIYARPVCMYIALWQFSNNHPNSTSVDYAMSFLMILHATFTG